MNRLSHVMSQIADDAKCNPAPDRQTKYMHKSSTFVERHELNFMHVSGPCASEQLDRP